MSTAAPEYLPRSDEAKIPSAPPAHPGRSPGWVKMVRGSEPLELIRANPLAFVLAAVIAYRARWREGFNADNLAPGEALLGDYEEYGMTEQEYRTAKNRLARAGFATFKPTNKGTVGRLTDTRLFSVLPSEGNDQNNGRPNEQPTTSQRPANEQPTTNEERKSRKSFEKANSFEAGFRNSKGTGEEERPDWNGMNTKAKMLKILGNQEIAKRPDWITRAERHPKRIEAIMDAMHADIATGRIIKNRGAYAEHLWKIAK